MFLNPWYLQQGANGSPSHKNQIPNQNQNELQNQNVALDTQPANSASPSPQSSSDGSPAPGRGMQEGDDSHSPSPAPSLLSAGSCGSGNHNSVNLGVATSQQLAAIQSSLRPGWTVHITPEGRLYYCKWVSFIFYLA
jgi:hypothetical protein